MTSTVREAAFEVLRECGMVDVFANPGSTEVPFLVDLPADLRFVLALHEGSVVGLATGYAIATDRPALALLHTTAGLGNAVGALATARVNRAPLVVLVGQQDRRHLALEPFLAGRLDSLAGDYPVWVDQPVIPQDVPAAIRRAWHEAAYGRGPAIVVVPMDDWSAPLTDGLGLAAPAVVRRPAAADEESTHELARVLDAARAPVLVVGAGADSPAGWSALTGLAERLDCPVWQESFGARAGFPQDHRLFAGHLPAARSRLRDTLAAHDVVLVVGTAAFRQYPYEPGPLTPPGTTILVISDDPAEVHRSPAHLAVLASPALTCTHLTNLLTRRTPPPPPASPIPRSAPSTASPDEPRSGPSAASPAEPRPGPSTASPDEPRSGPSSPPPGPRSDPASSLLHPPSGLSAALLSAGSGRSGEGNLRAVEVFGALAERVPEDVVLVEECPSDRPALQRMVPARAPRGFVSAAMGGLGFAVPAAAGLRMGDPSRPVVAVVGDGSTLYGIHALWSAARYGCGVLYVVLSNGRYAVMDRLAERAGGKPPWPDFADVDVAGLARSFGCPAERITDHAALITTLDQILPTLAERRTPLVLDVRVIPEERFEP